MREYIQGYERGSEKMTMYFDFTEHVYVIEGFGRKTFRFTDIYEADKFMKENGWD